MKSWFYNANWIPLAPTVLEVLGLEYTLAQSHVERHSLSTHSKGKSTKGNIMKTVIVWRQPNTPGGVTTLASQVTVKIAATNSPSRRECDISRVYHILMVYKLCFHRAMAHCDTLAWDRFKIMAKVAFMAVDKSQRKSYLSQSLKSIYIIHTHIPSTPGTNNHLRTRNSHYLAKKCLQCCDNLWHSTTTVSHNKLIRSHRP